MPVKFSNPRLRAEFGDWPYGGSKRGKCVFAAEFKEKKGWRVGRTTTGATKFTTYSGPVAIVDGDDGKTYILQSGNMYKAVTVSRSDFKNAEQGVVSDRIQSSTAFADSADSRYEELMGLIR